MEGHYMIKLFESWRKYLKEDVYGKDFLLKLGLNYLYEEGDFEIQLIHKDETTGQLKVVGMIETMQMGDTGPSGATPCIPETREIGAVAVDSQFKGKGLGTYLYEVASFLVTTHDGGGITSDHSASTTNDAAKVWNRLEKSLKYTKRKTAKGSGEEEINMETGEVTPAFDGGNDEFDYNNSTPDPNDDCYPPAEGKPASDNSLQIPDSRMEKIGEIMHIQMDNYDSWTENKVMFSREGGMDLFDKEYKPKEAGIYGKTKK